MAVGARMGRNDPCPCGSGRKYKRCCLARDEAPELLRLRMRRAEGRLVPQVVAYAHERYGYDLVTAAWWEFTCWEEVEAEEEPLDREEFTSAFLPWFVFNWTADPHEPETSPDWPREPLARVFTEEHGARLDDFERRFVEVACGRPFSFYAVTVVERGRALGLRDVLTRREYTVLERHATECLSEGALVFARVVPMDGAAILLGCAPLAIPPSYHLRLLGLREQMARARGRVDEEDLHDWDVELRQAYFAIKEDACHPRLPALRNTDGDPLVPTTLRFDLRCAPGEAFARLKSLALDASDEELLADAERDAAGQLRAVRFTWLERGNRLHESWENTVLGTLAIDGRRLTIEVNSARRAERVRAQVEERLGEDVVFRKAVTESLEEQLARPPSPEEEQRRARVREESERLESLPEVQEAMRAFMARHWEAWLETKLPALRFETPRQAAKTPAGRERLEALFTEFAWHARHATQPELVPDLAALRARLGM